MKLLMGGVNKASDMNQLPSLPSTNPTSHSQTMSGIQVAPSPWDLKGTSWIFLLSPHSKDKNFPSGFSTEYQAERLLEGGEFIGGPGLVQLVSYTESPVGPYDELIYIPGRWKYPDEKVAFRITRIYVSSKESVENGRRNWNIPKQLAKFDYKQNSDGTTSFTVYPSPSHSNSDTNVNPEQPFFKASIRPLPLLSSITIPTNTSLLGNYFTIIQPPLPPCPSLSSSKTPEEIGTEQWAELTPIMKGKTKLMKLIIDPITGTGEGDDVEAVGVVGDGKGFPKVKPWSIGFVMNNLDLEFGVPRLFDGF